MSETAVALIVDTETTGLSAGDEPIELALIRCSIDSQGNQVGEAFRYCGRREPAVPINPRAQKVHGITLESLRGADFDHATVARLIGEADVLVAHNASFDARMLAKLYPDVRRKSWRCTYRQWPWAAPPGGRKLSDVAALCGLEFADAHSAPADADVLRRALLTRTGKTGRSKTHFAKLLAKGDHYVEWEPSARRQGGDNASSRVVGTINISLTSSGRSEGKNSDPPRQKTIGHTLGRIYAALGPRWSLAVAGIFVLSIASCMLK